MKSNKILFIILFIVLFCFCFSINSFASITLPVDGVNKDFPDVPLEARYYTIFSYKGNYYLCYTLDADCSRIQLAKSNMGGLRVTFLDKSGNCLQEFRYRLENDSWNFYDSGTNGFIGNSWSDPVVYYSKLDIYGLDGTIFFQKTPLAYQIPAITEVNQVPEVIVGILKVIIPVGLIVLSVGFLIYLIKSVISRAV